MRGLRVLLLIAIAAPALAQDAPRGQGYVFFAPGAVSAGATQGTYHVGAGGEGLIYKGLGAGGEIGYLAPWDTFRGGVGVVSANGSYHFRRAERDARLVPFVTSGYTLMFHSGSANLFNFGGGVNYWFKERWGLRLEFRDHVWPNSPTAHYWGFRIGLAFR